MTEAERQFMRELQALCAKYGVRVEDHDGYDMEDEYTGTDWYIRNGKDGEDMIGLHISDVADNIF